MLLLDGPELEESWCTDADREDEDYNDDGAAREGESVGGSSLADREVPFKSQRNCRVDRGNHADLKKNYPCKILQDHPSIQRCQP